MEPDSDTGKFFDTWRFPALRDEEYQAVLALIFSDLSPGKKVLDVGCGTGGVARLVKSLGHWVIGLDVSAPVAQQALQAGRVDQVVVADVQHIPLPDRSVDVVLCFGVLLYVFQLEKAMQELHRVLKPGGRLLIFDHHHRSPYEWLHFHRPGWVDWILEGRRNVPRRLLTERLVADAGRSLFEFSPPVFFSLFTTDSNVVINVIHGVARFGFGCVRKITKARWTANCIALCGKCV